jgi:hypothetical protein
VPPMVAEPLVIEFDESHRDAVVTRMAKMAAARQGWVNLSPGLAVDTPPLPRSALGSLFSARGPAVPLGTWSAPGRSGRDPSTIGIQHGQGPRVLQQLDEAGLGLPEGWRRLQDHPRRGLVCVVPASDDPEDLDAVLGWLLQATGWLCPLPRTGEWRAICYRAI